MPKLSDRGVVLVHDINVRERGFGVWRFWEEISKKCLAFEFLHCHGLGVLNVGRLATDGVHALLTSTGSTRFAIREIYAELGRRVTLAQSGSALGSLSTSQAR